MSLRNTTETYGCVTKFLHALVAILFLVQIIIGVTMGYISNKSIAGQVYTFHKSLGIVILAVAILFILWRLINPKPRWPESMPCWERFLAKFIHVLLYILLLAMPLSGWIMSTASGHAPDFFWICKLPMPGITLNKALARTAGDLHTILAWTIAVAVVIHVLGALKHHFISKDNILRRMC